MSRPDELRQRLRLVQLAMVPVAVAGLAFVATIFGIPIGLALWALVLIVVRDSNALLRGDGRESRRLAFLCRSMALCGGGLLGLVLLVGYDDLFGHFVNVLGLGLGIVWVFVVARGAESATVNAQTSTP